MHQRILFKAIAIVLAALSAHASAQGSSAGTGTATVAAATVVAAAATVPATESRTSNAPAAGSDLALLFGGLGAIGFVSLRRGRFEG